MIYKAFLFNPIIIFLLGSTGLWIFIPIYLATYYAYSAIFTLIRNNAIHTLSH